MRWVLPLGVISGITILTGVFLGSHIGTRFDSRALIDGDRNEQSFKKLEGAGTKLTAKSPQPNTQEVTALLSDGNLDKSLPAHSASQSPKSAQNISIQVPSASDIKHKVQHEVDHNPGSASGLQQQHQQQQQQHADSDFVSSNSASPSAPGTNSTSTPVSAGWSSRFTAQLSAAADKFKEHAQTATSAATTWFASNSSSLPGRPAGLGQAEIFPWSTRMVDKRICDDSCDRAKDGRCDDGSLSEDGQVWCDLGTDCTDCGPWTLQVPEAEASQTLPKPIQLLRGRQIDVFVKNTTTVPSFKMAYTDAKKDVDVSGQMEFGGVVELGLTQMWYQALRHSCVKQDGSRGLVVDVGANFGWYSVYAASLGCRVVAWEPVPHFRAFLEYNRQLNRLDGLVDIRDGAVAEESGKVYNLVVPGRGIWGTAGIGGMNIDRAIPQEFLEEVSAVGERIDEVVQEDALLMKVDVEGLEPAVMASARGLLRIHKIDHIVMEYTPGAYEVHSDWAGYMQLPEMLTMLLKHNYTILHVSDDISRAPLLDRAAWTGEMGAFKEVRLENVQYDAADALLEANRTMGCPLLKELVDINPAGWRSCNAIPEDLHPKSFRATFGHNTNIWLAANHTAFKVGDPVGIMKLEQEVSGYYSQDPLRLGMGYRGCDQLDPTVQVRHRCKCTDASVCGKEAKLVERLIKAHKLTAPIG